MTGEESKFLVDCGFGAFLEDALVPGECELLKWLMERHGVIPAGECIRRFTEKLGKKLLVLEGPVIMARTEPNSVDILSHGDSAKLVEVPGR